MGMIKELLSDFSAVVSDAHVLLVVPPFAEVFQPPLGVHTLQACAGRAGFSVSIFYAHFTFAAIVGSVKSYRAISAQLSRLLSGERVFAATAYDVPPLGYDRAELLANYTLSSTPSENGQVPPTIQPVQLAASEYERIERLAGEWVEAIATAIAVRPFKVVGCTTMFEQTAASVAILDRVKRLRPDVVTIIGGPNCEDEMAEGIASLGPNIDYIFSGESEHSFVEFLQQLAAGKRPLARIIRGRPLQDMNSLPLPDFQEYYDQLHHYLPEATANPDAIYLAYESSRGCWWGEKHHCTFCGLNGMGIGFREKSAEKVLQELQELLARHPWPSVLVMMADNIMPYSFFKTLVPELPKLTAERPLLKIFYELKANLSLEQLLALKAAGITEIQPGIESLSTSLLRRMDKGVTAGQNIRLLRYARSLGLFINWNLLYGFPGDECAEYEEMLSLMPLLHHLQPPVVSAPLSIDRFSPYFDHPDTYGVSNIKPLTSYEMLLPPHVNAAKVAYHFTADYEAASLKYPEQIMRFRKAITEWQKAWQPKTMSLFFGTFKLNEEPVLEVVQQDNGRYLLRDTRGLSGTHTTYELTPAQASAALVPRRYQPAPELEWALAHQVGVCNKNQFIPLATASPEILLAFEAEASSAKKEQPVAV
jgi:ribosomal peptide maturation radical SAM protein 1